MAYIRELTQDVEIHDESKVFKGYTLFAPMFGNMAWLVDMAGRVVHYWEMKNPTGNHARLTPNGTLLWHGRGPDAIEDLPSSGTELVEVDWEGNEVWRYDDKYLNHDFICLENGNILILRFADIPEGMYKNIKGGMPGTEVNGKIYGVSIHEITKEKEIVWQWENYKHLDIDKDRECPLAPRMVWGYSNSVDVFSNGDILLSMRHFNTVARIDKKTGDIIWRWGPDHLLGHQHCATVLENGNVLIFDNGMHRKFTQPDHPLEAASLEASRAVEVNPETNEIVWEYIDPQNLLYTCVCGSAQRLPNGNTLICESKRGIFYEVTYDKEVVWKYRNPFVVRRPLFHGWSESKLVFQCHRYGRGFEGFENKSFDPDKFIWTISKKTKEDIDEEELIKRRLARAGY